MYNRALTDRPSCSTYSSNYRLDGIYHNFRKERPGKLQESVICFLFQDADEKEAWRRFIRDKAVPFVVGLAMFLVGGYYFYAYPR